MLSTPGRSRVGQMGSHWPGSNSVPEMWRGGCPESEDHEAGPSRHERNGGGATCNQWGAEGRLGGSSKGSSGDWAFMKCQGIGFGALWRTELQAPGRQNEALKGLPGMPSE